MAEINFTGSIPLVPATANTRELLDFSGRAYSLYNILSFMTGAMDDDLPGAQPVKCTLIDLRQSAESLADDLGNASDRSRQAGKFHVSDGSSERHATTCQNEVARLADSAIGSVRCLYALASEAIGMPGSEAERQLASLAVNMLPIVGAQMDRILASLGAMRTGAFDEHIEAMGLHVKPYAAEPETAHE